jgi:hypothetical protein
MAAAAQGGTPVVVDTNGTSIAVRQQHRDNTSVQLQSKSLDTMSVAKMLAESGFFGEVKQQGQALAKILAGQELGMGPIASLMGVYFSNGKITYSANLMAASIKRSGVYTFRIKQMSNEGCTLAFYERGEMVGESSFTIEDARKADLTTGPNKHTWAKFPRNMCFARAMSNGAKWYCPDVFGGITPYTPDELGAEVRMTDDGEMVPVKVEVIEPAPPAAPVDRDRLIRCYQWLAAVATERKHEKAEAINKRDPQKLADDQLVLAVNTLRGFFPDITDETLAAWEAEDDAQEETF